MDTALIAPVKARNAECVFLGCYPIGGRNLDVLPMHKIEVRNLNATRLGERHHVELIMDKRVVLIRRRQLDDMVSILDATWQRQALITGLHRKLQDIAGNGCTNQRIR